MQVYFCLPTSSVDCASKRATLWIPPKCMQFEKKENVNQLLFAMLKISQLQCVDMAILICSSTHVMFLLSILVIQDWRED